MSNLTVYNASAGSGKTFTLSAEYISKLLNGEPDAANHILAVTFTNKATTEMKERILQNLYDIAYPTTLPDGTPAKDGFFDKVKALVGGEATDETLRRRARAALGYVLHNYERFTVQTIDSFLQSTLQYVARELGQTANYAVDIDDGRVILQAVDDLMTSINEKRATRHVRDGVKDMMNEKIEDNKTWDITRDLNDFAQNLSKEAYMRYSEEITACIEADKRKPADERFASTLHRLRQAVKQDIIDAASQALEREADIAKLSYSKRYSGRCRNLMDNTDMALTKEFSDTFTNCATLPDDEALQMMLKKNDLNNPDMRALALELRSVLKNVYDVTQENLIIYNSCSAVLKHLNELELLDAINRNVEAINRENNRIMLSRTPLLFDQLHAGSEASFVFEKAGVRYDHVMIDEFQDTSRLQWENFKKLLIESASKDKSSLLVGDVKQSIYRWRNGDWGILANIRREVSPSISIQSEPLMKNFRSYDNIVRFNYLISADVANSLDGLDEGLHPGEISQLVYREVEQECHDRPGGYVRVATADGEDKWGFDQTDLAHFKGKNQEETMLEDMAMQIEALHEAGHPYNSMAVLVRTNKQGKAVLKYFATYHPDVKIISDEAYTLAASPAVELLRSLLRVLVENHNSVACSYIAEQYCKKQHADFDDSVLANIKKEGIYALAAYLPADYIDNLEALRHIPLYECCEEIISLFGINKMPNQEPYIYAFLDEVIAYMGDESSELYAFLKYLDETIEKKSISSGSGDGVVVMTIHKSKGLAFDTVFLPYCSWGLKSKSDSILWVNTAHIAPPFNTYPLLPLVPNQNLGKSVFCDAYFEENFQNRVDALNMLYVAITRARKNLYIWCDHTSKGDNIGNYLKKYVNQDWTLLKEEEQLDETTLRVINAAQYSQGLLTIGGKPVEPTKKVSSSEKTTVSRNPLIFEPEAMDVPFESIAARMSFKQSNESRRFLSDGEDAAGALQDGYIDRGKLLHAVFAGIYTAADIATSVASLHREGLIASQKEADEIAAFIRKRISEGQAAEWFDGTWTIFNECTILSRTDGGTLMHRRPDRVMTKDGRTIVVDFKFGKPKADYEHQVAEYMQLLRGLGHTDVRGYLWYVYKGEIFEVK